MLLVVGNLIEEIIVNQPVFVKYIYESDSRHRFTLMNPVRCLLSNGVNTDYKYSYIREIEIKRKIFDQ